MGVLLSFVCLLLLCSGHASFAADTSAPDLFLNLRHWWRGDAAGYDSIVGRNAITNQLRSNPGKVGLGFDLMVQPGSLKHPLPQPLTRAGFTIEAWVRRGTLAEAGWSQPHGWIILGPGVRFGLERTGPITYRDVSPGRYVYSTGLIADVEWHHIAVTVEERYVTFYIDGLQDSRVAFTSVFELFGTVPNDPISIGEGFRGSIDELGIYSPPATPDQIRALHQAGATGRRGGKIGLHTSESIPARMQLKAPTVIPIEIASIGSIPLTNATITFDLPPDWTLSSLSASRGTAVSTNHEGKPAINIQGDLTGGIRVEPAWNAPVAGLHPIKTISVNNQQQLGQPLILTQHIEVATIAPLSSALSFWLHGNPNEPIRFPGGPSDLVPGPGIIKGGNRFYTVNSSFSTGISDYAVTPNLTVETWLRRADSNKTTLRTDEAMLPSPFRGGSVLGASFDTPYFGIENTGSLVFGSGQGEVVRSEHAIIDTNWHHVGFVREGDSISFYIDGELSGAALARRALPAHDWGYMVGAIRTGPPAGGLTAFYGDLDEFATYSRSLTSDEIRGIFRARDGGKARQNIKLAVQHITPFTKEGEDAEVVFALTNLDLDSSEIRVTAQIPSGLTLKMAHPSIGSVTTNETGLVWDLPRYLFWLSQPTLSCRFASPPGKTFVVHAQAFQANGDYQSENNAVLAPLVFKTGSCVEERPGLAAWYPFDGIVRNDFSGEVKTGDWSFDEGWSGQALRLGFEKLQISNPAYSTEFTLSVWYAPGIRPGTTALGTENIFNAPGLTVDFRDQYLELHSFAGSFVGTTPINSTSVFQHITVIRDTSHLKLYLNGILELQSGAPSGLLNSTNLWLGRGVYGTGRFDELVLFNRALNPSELMESMVVPDRTMCHSNAGISLAASNQTPALDSNFQLNVAIRNDGIFPLSNVRASLALPGGVDFIRSDLPANVKSEIISGRIYFEVPKILPYQSVNIPVALRGISLGPKSFSASVNHEGFDNYGGDDHFSLNVAVIPITVRLQAIPALEIPEGDSLTIRVSLPEAALRTHEVPLLILPGTALPGVDFDDTTSHLTFLPGEYEKTVIVTTHNRPNWRGFRTFQVAIGNLSPALAADPPLFPIIQELDPPPIVEISGGVLWEQPGPGQSNGFRINISGGRADAIRLEFALSEITAVPDTHFKLTSGSIAIPPEAQSVFLPVEVLSDGPGSPSLVLMAAIGASPNTVPPLFRSTRAVGLLLDSASDRPTPTYSWDILPSSIVTNVPFRLRLSARDQDGNLLTNYSESFRLSASPTGYPPAPVVVSEVDPRQKIIRLLNVSPVAIPISNWSLDIYSKFTWPGAISLDLPSSGMINPGEVREVILGESQSLAWENARARLDASNVEWDFDYPAANLGPIGVVLRDSSDHLVDSFFAHPAHPGEVVAPAPIPTSFWKGQPADWALDTSAILSESRSQQRLGNHNSRSAFDWIFAANTQPANSRLNVLPFPESTAAFPNEHAQFTNGIWEGTFIIAASLSPLIFRAAPESPWLAHLESLTGPIQVHSEVDLDVQLSFSRSDSPTVSWREELDYLITIRNLGPSTATNIVIDWSGVGLGVERVQGLQNIVLNPTLDSARFRGEIPTIPSNGRSEVLVTVYPSLSHGLPSWPAFHLTSASASVASDGNPLNNSAFLNVRPGHYRASDDLGLLASYRLDGNFLDDLGLHHGLAPQGIKFVAGETGIAAQFPAPSSHFLLLPSSRLFGRPRLTIEALVRLEAHPANTAAVILQQTTPAHSWRLKLANGEPILEIERSQPDGSTKTWLINTRTSATLALVPADLRDGLWHHIALLTEPLSAARRYSIFINGTLSSSRELPYSEVPFLALGGQLAVGGFEGELDDLILHSELLDSHYQQSVYRALGSFRIIRFSDNDSDGIFNSAENVLGTSPSRSDSHLDTDRDGVSNIKEILAGSYPLNQYHFPVVQIEQNPFRVTIVATAGPNRTATLFSTPSLSNAAWKTEATGFTDFDGTHRFEISRDSLNQEPLFFKVEFAAP